MITKLLWIFAAAITFLNFVFLLTEMVSPPTPDSMQLLATTSKVMLASLAVAAAASGYKAMRRARS